MANHCALIELALARSMKATLVEDFDVLKEIDYPEAMALAAMIEERLAAAEAAYEAIP